MALPNRSQTDKPERKHNLLPFIVVVLFSPLNKQKIIIKVAAAENWGCKNQNCYPSQHCIC